MPSKITSFLRLLLILLGTCTQAQAANSVPSSAKIFSMPTAKGAKLATLKAVLMTPSKWSEDAILRELQKVNRIYAQCGVQFAKLELTTIADFPTVLDMDLVQGYSLKLKALGIRPGRELVLSFAAGITGDLLSLGSNSGGFAFNLNTVLKFPDLQKDIYQNLGFVLEHVQFKAYKNVRSPDYSPIAHELAHLLLNESHRQESNLLAGHFQKVNSVLTPDQCLKLKSNPYFASHQ